MCCGALIWYGVKNLLLKLFVGFSKAERRRVLVAHARAV